VTDNSKGNAQLCRIRITCPALPAGCSGALGGNQRVKENVMRLVLFLVLTIRFSLATSARTLDTLSYEPTVVTVVGVVVSDTFAGPPNYESIQAGDEPEVYWVLTPPSPIFVLGLPNDDLNVSESNISALQLVFADVNDYNKYRKFLNSKVKVTGTLFHAISGHHHTKVLLAVTNMVAR